MSTVFYRWGAGREESRVTFDGTHISVFDLKREIILANKMGNGKDFDIAVYDNVTGEELKDDNHQIPRSSSLIARRLPSSIKGRGNAQNYIVGTSAGESLTGDHRIESHARDAMLAKQNRAARGAGGMFGSMTKRFDGKEDKAQQPSVQVTTGNAEEDARIQAMFQQQEDQWEQDLDDMSQQPRAAAQYRQRQQRPPGAGGAGGSSAGKFDYSLPPDKEPPIGYICYRCGQKGHWIQNCPNNDDPAAQDRKRFVRVTGIPRSFLKTVDSPGDGEGSSGGAMLTADGGFVRAVPDQQRWQKEAAAKPRTLTGAEVRDQEPLDAELTCSICKKLVWEAVRTPCCDSAFCEECITTHLVEHAFECPVCESKVPSIDKLRPDMELREKVKGYVDGEIERSKKEEREEKEREGENIKNESEAGQTENSEKGQISGDNGNANGNGPAESELAPGMKFDAARMQEMLNPATMQVYLTQMNKMLQNPDITPQNRLLLQAQLQAVNATVLQMQMMAASGMMNGNANGGMPGNMMGGPAMGMGMGIEGNMGMGPGPNNMHNMGMGMFDQGMGGGMGMDGGAYGMGMGMGMDNGMGHMGGMGNMGMNNGFGGGGPGMNFRGGRGGRGGFRGRGSGMGFNHGPRGGGMRGGRGGMMVG